MSVKLKHPKGKVITLSKEHADSVLAMDKKRKKPVGYKVVKEKKNDDGSKKSTQDTSAD